MVIGNTHNHLDKKSTSTQASRLPHCRTRLQADLLNNPTENKSFDSSSGYRVETAGHRLVCRHDLAGNGCKAEKKSSGGGRVQ